LALSGAIVEFIFVGFNLHAVFSAMVSHLVSSIGAFAFVAGAAAAELIKSEEKRRSTESEVQNHVS
jgi:hypothetical protein